MHAPTPTSDPTAILVLGMHRGGTSAMAGLLHLLGFDSGPSLMPAVEGVNRKGFWEHVDVYRIHERLFAAFGRSIFDPREMPAGWREHPEFQSAVGEVRALIERDFAAAARWVVKDPRLCKFAPVWIEAFASLGIRTRVVMIARHPAEIARSTRAVGWSDSTARIHLCWLQYMFEAERTTRAALRSCVNYSDLLADWRTQIARIGQDLGIEWPALEEERAGEIDLFLDARERHHVESAVLHADAEDTLPTLVADLHETFRDHAGDGDLWTRVATLGDIYRRGEAVFGPCLDQDIIDLTLTRLAMEQQRASIAQSLQNDVVVIRYRRADENYRDEVLTAHHCELHGATTSLHWALPTDAQAQFLRVELLLPGAFVLRALRLNGVGVDAFAGRI
ncbi:MAG TPA: sulfotransferase, partial [Dokdonella sp.]